MQTLSHRQKPVPSTDLSRNFAPVLIAEIELGRPLPTLSAGSEERGPRYQQARCLVRLHTRPLGLVDLVLTGEELSPGEYAPYIWQVLGEQINAHLREDGLPEVTGLPETGLSDLPAPKCVEEREIFLQTAPFASVVISTRDRAEQLERCLDALLALHYPRYEVIIVDNAPATTATFDLVQQTYASESRVRYVREDRPGLSAGRNRGVLEARGEIIAITDDDVVVDQYWLAELVRGFGVIENVACVSGLLLPLELETPAQFLLEAWSGFTRGFDRRIFDLGAHRWPKPAYPYIVGACGTGASMAFRADFLWKEGGFDLALGTGTLTCGGEDLAIFFRTIIHGHRLVYEPTALLYHQHRREYAALQRQAYGYGVGFTAYLTQIVVDHPLLIFDCIFKGVRSLFYLARNRSSHSAETDEESGSLSLQDLKRLEWKGRLRGPLAYIRSRLAAGWTRKGLAPVRANVRRTGERTRPLAR